MGGTSLIGSEVTDLIAGFAGDVVPTVMSLVGILVPVGLTLWAIGFGIKKGLAFLKKNANKSI